MSPPVVPPSPLQPRPDQHEDAAWIRAQGRVLLGSDPGVGKTAAALLAADGDVLVACPAALTGVWEDELELWRPHLASSLDLHIVPYSQLARARLTERSDGKTVRTTSTELAQPWRRQWDMVIADEAHYLKSRKANWSKAFGHLSKRTDRLALLTGTPIPNWAYEIFMLLRYLNPGEYTNYWDWVYEWFRVGQNRFSGQMSKIGDLLPHRTWDEFAAVHFGEGDDCSYRRRLRDILDLPPLTEQTILTPMSDAQRRIYRDMKKALEATLPSGQELVTWTKGSQWPMLHAITTGADVLEDDYQAPGKRAPRASTKLSTLLELMAERTESPTVIFCAWRRSTEAVAAYLKQLGVVNRWVHGGLSASTRRERIRAFTHAGVPWLIGTYGTLAEGFTFTRADTVIRVERHPVPSKNEQAMRRIHRMGQTRPCLVIDLVTPGSVDSAQLDTLANKTDQQAELTTALELLSHG